MPEEIEHLVSKKICVVVDYPSLNAPPNDSLVHQYHTFLENSYRGQVVLQKVKKANLIEANLDKIIEGRRKKNAVEDEMLDNDHDDSMNILNEETSKIKDISKEQSLIQLRIGHVSWIENSSKEDPKEINWKNVYEKYLKSSSRSEKSLRKAAFSDLHSKGFYLSEGFNFGADFLAYPGDPLAFHAKYLIVCREMDFQESVGMARLANSVNKIVLSPSFDPEGSITYKSIEWSGKI